MADTATPSQTGGSSFGKVRGFGINGMTFYFASVLAGATYATGGQPVTPPPEISGKDLLAVTVLNPHDGTRIWSWNGSTTAPKLVAYDAFATQEGNGTDVSAVPLVLMWVYTG